MLSTSPINLFRSSVGSDRRQDRAAEEPASEASLAFASWVIGRLGGWTGYYGKPGPLVMRRGLEDFNASKYGATLRLSDV